jgi:cysteine desulfurase
MNDNRLYFNSCLTSKPAPEAVEAMLPYLRDSFYYPENFNKTGTDIAGKLSEWKGIIGQTIGAKAEEIHFTGGGTIGNNIAIKGYLLANAHKGNHIICSVIDYPDILANAGFYEQAGFEVTYLTADKDGFINLEQLDQAIRKETILFMTTLANHTVGTVQPVQKIKEILASADHKIAMFVDASEAYGKIAVSVNDMGIDLMSVSGHKIHGPQGSGFLYVRKGVDLAQLIHGIVRLDDLHTGGLSVANIAGMIRAIELIFADFEGHHSHLREISKYFWEQLQKKIPNIMLNGAGLEFRAPHNVNVSFDFIEGEAVMMMLDYFNVSVATGSACASQGLKPNYVLMALGRTHEQSHGSIKFTFTRYHTREDIDQLISKLEQVVSKLRKNSTLNPANKPDNQ